MENVYQSNANVCVDAENIKKCIKSISDLIFKSSKYVSNKIEVNKTKHEMECLAGLLERSEFFQEEYFDFSEIQDMITYALNRDFSVIKRADFDFILEIVNNFSDLINFKIALLEKDSFDEKKFKLQYDLFLSNMAGSKIYFYDAVCTEDIDEELFVEYCNIIGSRL